MVDLRTRAGILSASAAITTSFFGNAALADARLGALGWGAIAAFAVVCGSVLIIAWPRSRDWSFAVSVESLLATYVEPPDVAPAALPEIHRDLALHFDRERVENFGRSAVLLRCFRVGSGALVVEVGAWIGALVAQGS